MTDGLPAAATSSLPWRLLALLFAIISHAPALGHPFVYDDILTVTGNPALEPGQPLLAIVLQDRFRPLTSLGYALDARMWGREQPFGFHLSSLLWHLLAATLVFEVVSRLARLGKLRDPNLAAFVAAALMATHPLHSEAVGYVSARSEVQCAALFLAALWLWLLKSPAWPLLFGAALLSKESAAMFPLLLLAIDRVLQPDSPAERRTRLLRLHLPLCLVTALAAAARVGAHVWFEHETPLRGPWQNLMMQFEVIWRYLALAMVPAGQSLVHGVELVTRPTDARALLLGAGLLGLLLGALVLRGRQPLLALGMLWFLLLLAPSSSLLPLLEPMAEHRVYLASVGLFLGAGSLLAQIPRRGPVLAATLAIALTLTGLTRQRLRVWSDPVALWADAARKAPRVWLPHYALGDALAAAGQCERATVAYQNAIKLLPGEPRAWVNLGTCLADLGRFDQAEDAFLRASAIDPGNPAAAANLATVRRARAIGER